MELSAGRKISGMTKVIYVDESGDLGFGKSGSSDYLVIAYVATEDTTKLKKIVRKGKKKAGLNKGEEISGGVVTRDFRERFLTRLVSIEDLEIGAVVINKGGVYENLRPKDKQNILYAYAAGLILLPYLVRYDGCHINIDERSIKNRYGNMIDGYLLMQLAVELQSRHRFTFSAVESKYSLGLQAAHVVVNTIWRKYEKGYAEAYPIIEPKIVDEFEPFK